MIESLEDRIKRHEGFTSIAHPDAKGAYVIGYGHDIPECDASNYPDGCTAEEAENWLNADIAKATFGIINALPWAGDISEIRQEVLIEMAFQLGMNGLLAFHHMLAAARAENYDAAAQEMLNSTWHKQTPARCEELASLMIAG